MSTSQIKRPTPEDLKLISNIWSTILAAGADHGGTILITFFEKYPEELAKFKSFKGIEMNELKTKPIFKAHALRIIKAFDQSIESAKSGDFDACHQHLTALAANHVKREVAAPQYLNLQTVVRSIVVENFEPTPQIMAAWDSVFSYIFQTIIKGA